VRATYDEYFLNGNWLDGPLLPHKPLTKGPFFSAGPFLPDRFFRTVFTRTVLTGTRTLTFIMWPSSRRPHYALHPTRPSVCPKVPTVIYNFIHLSASIKITNTRIKLELAESRLAVVSRMSASEIYRPTFVENQYGGRPHVVSYNRIIFVSKLPKRVLYHI